MKKIVLITGASSGIGKAAVNRLLKDGHTVYGVARRLNEMKDIEDAGARVMQMDVMNYQQVKEVVTQIFKQEGRIDVLVNNAGYGVLGAVEDVMMEDARRQFEVNLFGLANLTNEVLPLMRAKGKGRIINIASVGGKIYTPLSAWYIASKHALEGWSDCLRLELKQHNIEVVVIEPGIIKTQFFDDFEKKLIEQSKNGAYQQSTLQTIELIKEANNRRFTSGPEVIGKVIARATRVGRPRTRYIAGYMGHLGLIFRRLIPDRSFDFFLRVGMKRMNGKI